MPTSPHARRGDPAFEGSEAITHAPLDEERRFDSASGTDALKRPFPWALIGVAVAVGVAAILVGAAAGAEYLIPLAVLAVLILLFALGSWFLGHRPEKVPETIPNFGVDERHGAGGSPDQSSERETGHDDMERSTGTR